MSEEFGTFRCSICGEDVDGDWMAHRIIWEYWPGAYAPQVFEICTNCGKPVLEFLDKMQTPGRDPDDVMIEDKYAGWLEGRPVLGLPAITPDRAAPTPWKALPRAGEGGDA
jgi:hypothetical protein